MLVQIDFDYLCISPFYALDASSITVVEPVTHMQERLYYLQAHGTEIELLSDQFLLNSAVLTAGSWLTLHRFPKYLRLTHLWRREALFLSARSVSTLSELTERAVRRTFPATTPGDPQ